MNPEIQAAMQTIRALIEGVEKLTTNKHVTLGDLVYNVREREGKGWNGKSVTQWSEAVTAIEQNAPKAALALAVLERHHGS